jgi:basic amino acid/polyamine antiporter, APA family
MAARYELRGGQFFTLAFGSVVGVGWVVVLGNWLTLAGPLGAATAFLVGGLAMMFVGLCYADMARLFPVSGGEVAYTYELYGLKTCFATGWFLALGYIVTAVFEATSVSWIVSTLAPGIEGPVLYSSRGLPVHLGSLILAIGGMVFITVLNFQGVKPAAEMQDWLTYTKIALAALFVTAGITLGKVGNINPPFASGRFGSAWSGPLAVFITTPFWLSGFNTVAQVVGEKSPVTSTIVIGRMILIAIGIATVFYVSLIVACSMTLPWPQLVKLDLPAAAGFEVGLHSRLLSRVVLSVALLSNLTVWNATTMCGAQVLFALGRVRAIPSWFGQLNANRNAPGPAVLFVGMLGGIGILVGRSVLLPVLNVASTCMAFAFGLICIGALKIKLRYSGTSPKGNLRRLAVPVVAVPVSLAILVLSFYEPYASAGSIFPPEWAIFLGWTAIGALFWLAGRNIRGSISDNDRQKILLGGK